jgi:hypothetical protein
MTEADYRKPLEEALDRYAVLFAQKEALIAELLKLRQFIYATINMLPDNERGVYQAKLTEFSALTGGLTDAVRETLKLAAQRQTYFSASEVRNHLVKSGFDFSRYTSNPLASVNTVLRRFKPGEVETTTIEGVIAYRWIFRFPRLSRRDQVAIALKRKQK